MKLFELLLQTGEELSLQMLKFSIESLLKPFCVSIISLHSLVLWAKTPVLAIVQTFH